MDLKVDQTFTLTLSKQEARAIIEDPTEFQHYLSVAVDGCEAIALTAKIVHEPRRPKAKARRGAGTARVSTTNCPVCGKEFNARGLGVHMARKHGMNGAPAAGDLLTPATP